MIYDYILHLIEWGVHLAENFIRTCFFVQNIDVNYAGVVKARNEVFVTQGLTPQTHYIASTGISGRHADAGVLVQMDTYAVLGLCREQIHYLYARDYLNPTYEYGVSFERGRMWIMEIVVRFSSLAQPVLTGMETLFIRVIFAGRLNGCGKMWRPCLERQRCRLKILDKCWYIYVMGQIM